MSEAGSQRGQQAFKLKGTAPALTLLYLLTEDLDAVERQLSDHLRQMPQFFLYAPIVVDLSDLGQARVDLSRLAELLRRHKLVPVAVRNPTDSQQVQAVAAGWAVLQNSLPATRKAGASARSGAAATGASGGISQGASSLRSAADPEAPPDVDAARDRLSRHSDPELAPEALGVSEPVLPGLTVRSPVRSGQIIHAVGGDLVILAPVSSGAEIIADGNIHVYAPLRGRALAGAQGNSDVSIFCLSLEAEFLSIGGHYLMADQIAKNQRGRPVRAHLEDGELIITSL